MVGDSPHLAVDRAERAAERFLDADGIPGWYPPADCAELERLAVIAMRAEGCLVEFGSYQGRSAAVIAAVADRELVCVDPWLDPPGTLPGATVLECFTRHTAGLAVCARRMGWREWLGSVEPYGVRIALCHIDADHSYTEVADAIRLVTPLLAENGVLCGHDYGWPDGSHADVTRAVDELLPDRHVGGHSVWSSRAARAWPPA